MDKYEILTYPRSRRGTFDVGRIGRRKHHIAGLLEVDVTEARRRLIQYTASGRKASLTAWLICVVAVTVAGQKLAHAINYGPERQVAFEDVDVSLLVEREVNGALVPLPMIIRGANRKAVPDIKAEINQALETGIDGSSDYVLTKGRWARLTGLFFYLPQWLRMLAWRILLKNPFTVKANMGTVLVTNIGMVGRFAGWLIPKSIHNLNFTVGPVYQKPWAVDGKVEVRDILHLTVLLDHDVMDGAPAARIINTLVNRMEKAEELEDY